MPNKRHSGGESLLGEKEAHFKDFPSQRATTWKKRNNAMFDQTRRAWEEIAWMYLLVTSSANIDKRKGKKEKEEAWKNNG